MTLRLVKTLMLGAALVLPGVPAFAASCGSGSFEAWLGDFKNEAAGQGISQASITAGLNGVTLDQNVLSRDRSQKVLSQGFEKVSVRRVPPGLSRGSRPSMQYDSQLARFEVKSP